MKKQHDRRCQEFKDALKQYMDESTKQSELVENLTKQNTSLEQISTSQIQHIKELTQDITSLQASSANQMNMVQELTDKSKRLSQEKMTLQEAQRLSERQMSIFNENYSMFSQDMSKYKLHISNL